MRIIQYITKVSIDTSSASNYNIKRQKEIGRRLTQIDAEKKFKMDSRFRGNDRNSEISVKITESKVVKCIVYRVSNDEYRASRYANIVDK